MRGASRNPTLPASTAAGSTRAIFISARSPSFCVRASVRSPAIASDRFSPTSGTTSAIVASATRSRWRRSTSDSAPEQSLAELVDDAGAAQVLERIVGRASRDDRTVRQLVARTMVVGDDDVEPELARPPDFLDRGDAAVDRQDEPATFLREPLERLRR